MSGASVGCVHPGLFSLHRAQVCCGCCRGEGGVAPPKRLVGRCPAPGPLLELEDRGVGLRRSGAPSRTTCRYGGGDGEVLPRYVVLLFEGAYRVRHYQGTLLPRKGQGRCFSGFCSGARAILLKLRCSELLESEPHLNQRLSSVFRKNSLQVFRGEWTTSGQLC